MIAPNIDQPKIQGGARGIKRLYVFIPKEDITAFELADAMRMINVGLLAAIRFANPAVCDVIWDQLSEGARRHFDATDLPQVAVAKQGPGKLELPPGARG